MTTLLKIIDDHWVYDDGHTSKSNILRLIKELIYNKGKVKKKYQVIFKILDISTTNDQLKILDWVTDNTVGIWQVTLYSTGRGATIRGKFNREEDALAFKLMWN